MFALHFTPKLSFYTLYIFTVFVWHEEKMTRFFLLLYLINTIALFIQDEQALN